ncbi:hypothetical protein KY326_01515 [Candidatus Woesearchaeota archaeon]|nr:hypothetical protein [Candidatus Woesearchaeota archaeon]
MARKLPRLTKEQQDRLHENVGDLNIQKDAVSNFISDNLDVAEALEKEIQAKEEFKKKIEEKKETEKKEAPRMKKKLVLFAIVLIVIFIASYFYFSGVWKDDSGPYHEVNKFIYYYDDFEFRQNADSTWSTEVYNPFAQTIYLVSLHYGPRDLEEIPVYGKDVREWLTYTTYFKGKDNETVGAGYVLFDPDVNGSIHALAYNELMRNMKRGLQLDAHPALTHNVSENKLGIPVKNCSETEEPIIWLRHQEPAMIEYVDDHCIIVQGTDADLVKTANKLLWLFYSVMEPRKAFV